MPNRDASSVRKSKYPNASPVRKLKYDRDASPVRKLKYDFKIQMVTTELFKMITRSIKMLLDDAKFQIRSDSGIILQAMDGAHVSLVQLQIKPEGFTEFICPHPCVIGLSVKSLALIMDRADKDARFELYKLQGKEEICIGWSTESRRVQYNMKLLDIESEDLGIPETEYSTIVFINSKEFKKMALDFQRSCDSLIIESAMQNRTQTFTFYAEGEEVSSSCTWIEGPDMQIHRFSLIKQGFSSRYLQLFSSACPLSSQVVLSLVEDAPLYVRFLLTLDEEAEENVGVLGFYLAPKIDFDD